VSLHNSQAKEPKLEIMSSSSGACSDKQGSSSLVEYGEPTTSDFAPATGDDQPDAAGSAPAMAMNSEAPESSSTPVVEDATVRPRSVVETSRSSQAAGVPGDDAGYGEEVSRPPVSVNVTGALMNRRKPSNTRKRTTTGYPNSGVKIRKTRKVLPIPTCA
jgi:hypothetical protein